MANQGIKGLRRFDAGGSTGATGPGNPLPGVGPGTGWTLTGAKVGPVGMGIDPVYTGDKPITRGPSGDYYDPLFPPSPNIQPLQKGETMQDYYTRLGQWEQTPEGQAVKAKQEADRWAIVNKIREGMGQGQTGGAIIGPGPNVSNVNINPNIGVQLPGITPGGVTTPGRTGGWQASPTGNWKDINDVWTMFRQTPGANPNPSQADLQYYLQKGPEQLLKDVQSYRAANPQNAAIIDQQRAREGVRFQGVYQPQYQNYANPLTMTNVSNYGTRPAPSAAFQNYASGNPTTPGGIPAMMQNIRNWADEYSKQGGANIGQIASDMQKYGINAADLQAAYSGGYGANAPSLFNASLYTSSPAMDAVKAQYAGLGRFGVGTGMGQIDPSGLQYWTNQLQSGAISGQQFPGAFQNAVQNYYNQYPTSGVTQMGQLYQNTYGGGLGLRNPFTPNMPSPAQPSTPFTLGTPMPVSPGFTGKAPTGAYGVDDGATVINPQPTNRPYYESYNQSRPQVFPQQGGFGGMGGGMGGFGGSFGGMPQNQFSAPIVTRSARTMGTPNVMMRRATGGILSLLKKKK